MPSRLSRLALAAGLSAGCTLPAAAQTAPIPAVWIALHVDASAAPQGILRVHETMAVTGGRLTLVYPQWIPGEHAPNGPIPNLVDLAISTGGRDLPWRRDPVDMYAFHVEMPTARRELDVDYTFVGNSLAGYDDARLATPNLLTLEWNKVVLTPQAADARTILVTPSITLPSAQWKFATALETASVRGAELAFEPAALDMLVDSPLDAGINARSWPLDTWDNAAVALTAFADTADELAVPQQTIDKFRALVAQDRALYVNRHFDHYTFLLTLSDEIPGEGLEHHQSSDNGEGGDYLIKPAALTAGADLLPHEFNHSWNGKYRRPYDLYTTNLNAPMVDDLLWVYEGMTQFYGDLLAERAGLRTRQQWLDGLALTYARLDSEHGRLTDPLADTATAASIRRGIAAWSSERRGQDYYTEGELMWLEADATIERLSNGRRSLDDVARAFFGGGRDSGPEVVTFNRADLIAALNAVQPFDWRTFFALRVDAVAPHPPDPFGPAGYRVVYADTPSDYEKLLLDERKLIDVWYSLGISAKRDGTIVDVGAVSVAGKAGIGPGEKIVAVNGRALGDRGQEQFDAALRAAERGESVRVLLVGGDLYRTVVLEYHGGPRFPRLERIAGTPDALAPIAKPLAGGAS